MTWPLRMVDLAELRARDERPRPGDCWYAPWLSEGWYSGEYRRDHLGKRPPVVVCLPNGHHWCPDRPAGDGSGLGWTTTGTPPRLTASPSIDAADYHGWLRDGVLSDDLEGRKYGGAP